jgi:hypothetical protein
MMVGSKFGKWQGAQFLEWSRIVHSSAPCSSNTPEGMIALILKIVRPEEVSRVSFGYRWRYTKSPISNCFTLGL